MPITSLNRRQAEVYFTIRKHGPINATGIGLHLGYNYEIAAQYVNRQLKHLVAKNLITRTSKNSRVVTYVAASIVDPPFVLLPTGEEGDSI